MIQKIQVNDRKNRNKNINKATIIVSNNKKRKRERKFQPSENIMTRITWLRAFRGIQMTWENVLCYHHYHYGVKIAKSQQYLILKNLKKMA